MIKKLLETTVVKGDRPRTFTFVASSGQLDRDMDRIPVESWSLDNFKANPVILWSHDHTIPAIARAVNVRVAGNALKATIEFPPEGIHPLADTVQGLVASGFLKAVSVGFRPSTYVANAHGGRDYQYPVDLLEISPVNLPANVDALLERRSDYAAVTKWLGQADHARSYRTPTDRVLEIDDSEPYLELTDDLIDIDLAHVARLIPRALSEGLVECIASEVRDRVDYLRGRVR